jgi:hypothetical protein
VCVGAAFAGAIVRASVFEVGGAAAARW